MKLVPALAALAMLGFAGAASAAPISVSFSSEFQESLDDDLGIREGAFLQTTVTRAIDAALARRGVTAAEGSIDVSVLDADPNRPTFHQLSNTSIDFAESRSVGGANLHAVVHGANGAVEVNHRRYDYSIDEYSYQPSTWMGAQRTIRQFAEKVADAYVAQAR